MAGRIFYLLSKTGTTQAAVETVLGSAAAATATSS
jgi:hypothetical protein